MLRRPSYLVILVLLASVVALVFEARDMAEQLGTAERVAQDAEQRATRAEQHVAQLAPESPEEVEKATADEAVGLADYTRLQVELHTARQQLEAVTNLLDECNAELHRRAKAAADAAESLLKPMPAGVHHCLQALHECLRAEGYQNHRFLRAMRLDAEGLHEVEMLEASVDGLSVTFVAAGRMTALLDRSVGRLELRFFDGHRAVDGQRTSLPEDGLLITFKEVDGRLFERRLPFLVRSEGSYPVAAVAPARPATDLDTGTQRHWLSRIEKVLDGAKTDLNWRVSRLRGLDEGHFCEVELIGTNDKNMVVASAHCDRLAFEIDERSGLVSLLLNDGVLRQRGVESTITGEGYRMLLPGLTPKETINAMLGMIVKR